jgi:23S rRNA (cytosine1962-C5)-methyltransferase/23S rRNA (guanine2445-N2)-methyltransferase / 23S rRNA (guanine2069-N7)-methyltransferase
MSEIRNRLEKNTKNLKPWAEKHQIEAYRLYERDIPDYPFIVDRYKDFFVVYDRGDERIDSRDDKREHFPRLIEALKDLYGTNDEHIVIKRRERQKGESQYEKTGNTNRTLTVREGPAVFVVNLYDYLDTGLFLDHRLMRQKIFSEATGKDFLNLFAYTGSVSVFAALGGARTVSVDMSATYSRWAQDNFLANGLNPAAHDFITEDALKYLGAHQERRRFDLIFLDPPTFSNSKRMESTFEVERDQEFLVDNAVKLLKPGGVLYFSNNKRTFKLSPSLSERYRIRDITAKTLPKDMRDPKVHHVFEIREK